MVDILCQRCYQLPIKDVPVNTEKYHKITTQCMDYMGMLWKTGVKRDQIHESLIQVFVAHVLNVPHIFTLPWFNFKRWQGWTISSGAVRKVLHHFRGFDTLNPGCLHNYTSDEWVSKNKARKRPETVWDKRKKQRYTVICCHCWCQYHTSQAWGRRQQWQAN